MGEGMMSKIMAAIRQRCSCYLVLAERNVAERNERRHSKKQAEMNEYKKGYNSSSVKQYAIVHFPALSGHLSPIVAHPVCHTVVKLH